MTNFMSHMTYSNAKYLPMFHYMDAHMTNFMSHMTYSMGTIEKRTDKYAHAYDKFRVHMTNLMVKWVQFSKCLLISQEISIINSTK